MRKTLAAVSLALVATMTLASCDKKEDLDGAADANPSAAASANAEASAGASPTPASDDAMVTQGYCDSATLGYDALLTYLEHTDAKSAQTGAEDNGSAAVMNAEGAAMVSALGAVVEEWTDAQVALGDSDADASVSGAYDAYFESVEAFSMPEAQIAAESGTIQEYSLATASLIMGAGVSDAAIAGANGLNSILEYNLAECGIDHVE